MLNVISCWILLKIMWKARFSRESTIKNLWITCQKLHKMFIACYAWIGAPGICNFAMPPTTNCRRGRSEIELRIGADLFPCRLLVSCMDPLLLDGTKSVFSHQRALLSCVDISGRDEQRVRAFSAGRADSRGLLFLLRAFLLFSSPCATHAL